VPTTPYVAYGLQLQVAFPLIGMTANEQRGLPAIELDLLDGDRLELAWSGPDGRPLWSGRVGGAHEFSIQSGHGGETMLSYADRARFLLSADGTSLSCTAACPELEWQRILLGKVLPSVSVMLGYEALHASAVDSPHGVVAIAAPSGMGKTTLALELIARGWPLFSDDVLILAADAAGIRASPGTPHVNVADREPPVQQGILATLGVLAGERWAVTSAVAQVRRPVSTVCLFERAPGLALEVEEMQPNLLPLSPYVLGLRPDTLGRSRRFALYADMVRSTRLLRLTAGMEDSPAELADALQAALDVRDQVQVAV
jgi:hypothetical protein